MNEKNKSENVLTSLYVGETTLITFVLKMKQFFTDAVKMSWCQLCDVTETRCGTQTSPSVGSYIQYVWIYCDHCLHAAHEFIFYF